MTSNLNTRHLIKVFLEWQEINVKQPFVSLLIENKNCSLWSTLHQVMIFLVLQLQENCAENDEQELK